VRPRSVLSLHGINRRHSRPEVGPHVARCRDVHFGSADPVGGDFEQTVEADAGGDGRTTLITRIVIQLLCGVI